MSVGGEIMAAGNPKLPDMSDVDGIIHTIVSDMFLTCKVSAEGKYEYTGATHRSILGYEPEELSNRSLFEFIHPDDFIMVSALFNEGLASGYFPPLKLRYRSRSNKYLYLESRGNAVYDNNNRVSGAVFVSRDISAAIMMENEMVRIGQLKNVGQLTAGLVHEIRNPITTVRGFLQMLGSNDDLKEYQDYLDLMIKELDSANYLITDFLSMTKDKKNDFAWQDLNQLIRSLYPVLAADAALGGHEIVLELADINEVYINGNQIRQLIVNLVNNGLEAMESAGIITIKTADRADNIILSVADQGPGIAPEVINNIGMPFLTTKEQGTGLGLSICKNIAANHKADLKFESNRQGTTFSLWLQDFKAINYEFSAKGNGLWAI